MRLAPALSIARKELREIARDRRSLLLMVGLPVLVYPLMMIGLSKIQAQQTEATEARRSMVALWGAVPDALAAALAADSAVTVRAGFALPDDVRRALDSGQAAPAPLVNPTDEQATRSRPGAQRAQERERENPVLAAARRAVGSRQVDAVLVAWPGFTSAVSGDESATVSVYYDSVRPDSVAARGRLDDLLADYRTNVLSERERLRGLPEGFVSAFELLSRDVAPPARQAGRILGAFLPFLLISLSLFGGFYPAVDLTAGEKERGTLQTLLCAPLRPLEIVVGKFLAVWVVSLATALINVTSLAVTVARLLESSDLTVPASAYALTAVMLVPVTMTTAAVFIAVAVFARDFKDGQNFLTPVYFLLILPAGATMLPGIELNAWTTFVPIVNIALLVKALLVGEWHPDLVFLTLLSSAAFAVLAMLLAVRVWEREQVLLGGRDSTRGLLGLERRSGGVPSPTLAIVLFAVVLVTAFYASLLLERMGILASLVIVQYGLFLAPAVLVVLGLGFSARETFGLRRPPAAGLAAALLLGLTAWTVVTFVMLKLAPPPDSIVKALERLLMLGNGRLPLWMVVLVVAVTPAICEEIFFRGLVMNGLRSLGPPGAIVGSALLFAVAHASIYRLIPTLLLGILLGYVAWKSGSIACSMIVHALNNGLIATVSQSDGLARALGMASASVPAWVVGIGASVMALALVILWRMPQPERSWIRAGWIAET